MLLRGKPPEAVPQKFYGTGAIEFFFSRGTEQEDWKFQYICWGHINISVHSLWIYVKEFYVDSGIYLSGQVRRIADNLFAFSSFTFRGNTTHFSCRIEFNLQMYYRVKAQMNILYSMLSIKWYDH
jgi:hypothetical protein